MKSFACLAVLAVFATAAAADNGPVQNRAQCYDLVIASCNANSSNPTACAVNGMDQCDEQFPRLRRPAAGQMTLILPEGPDAPGGGRGGAGVARY